MSMQHLFKCFSLFVFLILVTPAWAEEPAPVATPATSAPATKLSGYEKGGFVQVGGIFGYEMNEFSSLLLGLNTALGYQIDSRFGVLLKADFYNLSLDSQSHLGMTLMPTLRVSFIDKFYGFAGLGYNLLHAPKNSAFSGVGNSISRTYHSFSTEGGLGYTYFFSPKIGLYGEAGFNFTYIDMAHFLQTELLRPFARLGLSIRF